MPINNRIRRFGALSLLHWCPIPPEPDGTIGWADRQQVAGVWRGIKATDGIEAAEWTPGDVIITTWAPEGAISSTWVLPAIDSSSWTPETEPNTSWG